MNKVNQTFLSRRQAVTGALLAGIVSAIPGCATASPVTRHWLRPGVQLWPLSDEVAKDPDATFARLAAMGFKDVETAGFHGHKPAELKAAADRAGLSIVGAHIQAQIRILPTDRVLSDPDLAALISDLRELGVRNVVMPLPLLPPSEIPRADENAFANVIRVVSAFGISDWQRSAAFLSQRGEALRREGIRLSYHNHNMDFAPVGGTTGWDVLMNETDPADVGFELDIGWAAAAGRDPVELLFRNPGRIGMLHIKDAGRATKYNFLGQQLSAPLGKGLIRWVPLLTLAKKQGVTGYFVEQEPPFTTSAFDAMAQSIAYLRTVS